MRLATLIALLLCSAAVPAAAHAQAGVSYEIPPDNPFVNGGGAPEVYAIGLRNPFRFSFDRVNGDLLIGDVGGGEREEVNWIGNRVARGANFGWPCREGKVGGPVGPPDTRCPSPAPAYVEPLFDYDNPGGAAVTAGFVVRNPGFPGLDGRALYADFGAGEIRSLALNRAAPGDTSTGLSLSQLASFGEDAAGGLYAARLSGQVHRLVAGGPPGTLSSSQLTGPWDQPIAIGTVPGDANRLLVAERPGRVRLVVNGIAQPGAIAQVPNPPGVSTDSERGLLSVAAAPDYLTSGRLFVYYTDAGGDIRLDEFSPAGRRELLTIEHSSAGNHNGGTLQFGPDGCLWITTGDGGGQEDQFGNAQNPATLLGKILRIDPDPPGSSGPVCRLPETVTFAPPPGPGPAADTAAPTFGVRVKRRQRVLRLRGVVAYVRCSEPCSIAAGGRLRIRNRRFRLRQAAGAAQVGQRRRMKVLLTRKGRRALKRALRRGRRPKVRVNLRAHDAAGNRSPLVSRTVRVRR